MTNDTLISECCGATANEDFQNMGLCPDCREHTGFAAEESE